MLQGQIFLDYLGLVKIMKGKYQIHFLKRSDATNCGKTMDIAKTYSLVNSFLENIPTIIFSNYYRYTSNRTQ